MKFKRKFVFVSKQNVSAICQNIFLDFIVSCVLLANISLIFVMMGGIKLLVNYEIPKIGQIIWHLERMKKKEETFEAFVVGGDFDEWGISGLS